MLRMDQIYVVRHKVLVEKLSQRQVAHQLGISRNTVAKYLEVSTPKRVERNPRSKPVTEKVAGRIDELLLEWGPRTTAKQRITATRLHRQLCKEGFTVGITTVKDYFREKRRQAAEVYIPLLYRPGEVAQVDFFEVTIEEAGQQRKVWKFLLRLMYSGYDYIWLYERCDKISFLDAHVRAFALIGGVPARLVYDNLSAAVRRIVGAERLLNERFKALASHYLFEPCFARPGEGHDKGGVESRGKNIRLQHLVPIPCGDNLAEIAQAVLQEVHASYQTKLNADKRTVAATFAEEKKHLRALPPVPFDPRRKELVEVSNKSLVRIDGADYAVPETWARLQATAYVGVEDVKVCCLGEEMLFPKQQPGARYIKYRNYLRTLQTKPQATRQVAPQLIEELGEPFPQLWQMISEVFGGREAGRVLSRLLGAIVDHGEEAVKEMLSKALSVDPDNLLALAGKLQTSLTNEPVKVPESLQQFEILSSRASDYDWLMMGGVE